MKFKLQLLLVSIIGAFFFSQTTNAQTVELPSLLETPGDLYAWGYNNYGQIGIDDTSSNVIQPTEVSSDVVYISAGELHALFIKSDSTLWGMGANNWGQLGIGDENTTEVRAPVKIAENVVYAKAQRSTSFYVTSDGTLWGMGHNGNGKLGFDSGGETQYSPVEVPLDNIVRVHGTLHTLYLASDGTMYGSGRNGFGELGANPDSVSAVYDPRVIDQNVKMISGGYNQTLYIKGRNNSLYGLGKNNYGQRGIGEDDTTAAYVASKVGDFIPYVNCSAQQCVSINANDNLFGFGRNTWGQLGDGTTQTRFTPTSFEHGDSVATAATGQRHSLYRKMNGQVWVTGHNDQNQLAMSDTVGQIETPRKVDVGSNNAVMISTSGAFNLVLDQPDITGIGDNKDLPNNITLHQNYPNPFNPSTKINFELPQSHHVVLNVYNTLGQKVATLVDDRINAGSHSVTFDASNLTSGVYIYQIKTSNYTETKKMILLK